MDPEPKRPRLTFPVGGGTNIDDLPNELLQLIISDLPTKDAVRTSVLSKTWEKQWREIIKLDLQQDSHQNREQFIEFVERLREGCIYASRLEKFSLSFDADNQTDRLNSWFHDFINPKIEELNLVLEGINQPLVFPEHMFNSETLTKLHLSMPFVMNLPASVYLRCLKVLVLKHVIFSDAQSAQRLFSGCPLLEELTLIDCNWTNVRIVCISCPMLKKLIIREWRDEAVEYEEVEGDGDGDDAASEPEENDVGPSLCRILIIGNENMTDFAYDGDMINDYFLYGAESVINATVEVHAQEDNPRDVGYFVFMLLRALTNVKRLSITQDAVEGIRNTIYPMVHVPLLNSLKELYVDSSFPIDLSNAALLTVFRNSPCLESIEFVMGVTMSGEYEEFNIDPLPGCFTSHLKHIRSCSFAGNSGELNAIKYLLTVTPLLEIMDLYSNMYYVDHALGAEELNELYDQIMEFPMANEECFIYIE